MTGAVEPGSPAAARGERVVGPARRRSAVTEADRGRAALAARWPWWLQVLVVHAAGRAVGAVVLAAVARSQAANPWTGPSPSLAEYAGLMWDASWYRTIAEDGYPDGLPRGADGRVPQNAWAFFPLFPLLVRPLLAAGLPWHVAAPALALVLGALAALAVHAAVRAGLDHPRAPRVPPRVRRWLPLTTVALLQVAPAAPVLQVAYTESLALLLVALALGCVLRRRPLVAVPVVLALGLTRAVALPVAAAVAADALDRWRAHRAGREVWPTAERWRTAVLGAACVAAGLAWPVAVGVATGERSAYAQTQAAWRGRGEVVPLLPWLDVARWLVDGWAPLLLAAVAAGVAAVLAAPTTKRLPAALRGWTAGYLAYLVVVLEPGTSLVRFLLLAFPLAAALGAAVLAPRRAAVRLAAGLAVAVVGLATQVAWVALLWRLVPPSGWPP